jgi:hypothetical protein
MPSVHGLYMYIYVSITHVQVPYMHVRPLLQMPIRECGGADSLEYFHPKPFNSAGFGSTRVKGIVA